MKHLPHDGARRRWLSLASALMATALAGCPLPIDPGADLPEDAGAPALGALADMERDEGTVTPPMIDMEVMEETDITGTFEADAQLSPVIGDPVPVSYLLLATQEGVITDGDATVTLEARDPMNPDAAGATFDEPAAISAEGAFSGQVTGLIIPSAFTDMLLEDADATLDVDATILSSDCFSGTMKLTLIQARLSFDPDTPTDVELEGPFVASRQGTDGCATGQGGEDMGASDMGDAADMGG